MKPEAATGGGTPPSNRFSRSPPLLGGRGDLGTDAAPSRLNQPIDLHAPAAIYGPSAAVFLTGTDQKPRIWTERRDGLGGRSDR